MLGCQPKSSNPQHVIWPPLFELVFFPDFLLPCENPYLKLKHVVTTCIHLSGISSECGIHNLKRENSWCIINTMLYECVFFACFHSTLTQTSFACLPKISIVLSILQWKRYAKLIKRIHLSFVPCDASTIFTSSILDVFTKTHILWLTYWRCTYVPIWLEVSYTAKLIRVWNYY